MRNGVSILSVAPAWMQGGSYGASKDIVYCSQEITLGYHLVVMQSFDRHVLEFWMRE